MDKLQETAKSVLLGEKEQIDEASDEEIAEAMQVCAEIQSAMSGVIEQLQDKSYIGTVRSANKFMPGVTRSTLQLIKGAKEIKKTAIQQEGRLLDQLNIQMRHRKNESKEQQIDETLSNNKIYQNLVRRSAIIQQDLDDIHDEDSRQFKETEKELGKIWKEMNKIEKQHGIKR